ncbi:MAG: glutamate--cysteine ligase, partial [Gammaproteobacteria bacterium]|nr:glutamate--cysteine ligase [Gammaproteobacteria bacterium]
MNYTQYMGDEIEYKKFRQSDYQQFVACLEGETALVKEWFDNRRFSSGELMAGYELEAWLINKRGHP